MVPKCARGSFFSTLISFFRRNVCSSRMLYHLFYWCDYLSQVSPCSSVSMEVLKVVWAPQWSDTSSITLDLFLGHLSMLQRKRDLLRLCTVSVVGVCSWIFYCWCKLCINELQALLLLPPPHQMFVKLNPWMPAIEDGAPLLYCVWWFCWVRPCWLHWMPDTVCSGLLDLE